MKKIFSLLSLIAMLGGLILSAHAMTTSKTMNNCDMVIHDYGSYFTTADTNFLATLIYDSRKGMTVSGSVMNGFNKDSVRAEIINSTCDESIIILNWDVPNFKGTLKGHINVRNRRIDNLVGTINDLPVNLTLIQIG